MTQNSDIIGNDSIMLLENLFFQDNIICWFIDVLIALVKMYMGWLFSLKNSKYLDVEKSFDGLALNITKSYLVMFAKVTEVINLFENNFFRWNSHDGIGHFKANSSVALTIFTMLNDDHLYLLPKHFSYSK